MKSHGEKREKYREMPPEVYFNSVWENPSKWWMLKCHVSLGKWEKVEEFTNGDKIGIYWDNGNIMGRGSHVEEGGSICFEEGWYAKLATHGRSCSNKENVVWGGK